MQTDERKRHGPKGNVFKDEEKNIDEVHCFILTSFKISSITFSTIDVDQQQLFHQN